MVTRTQNSFPQYPSPDTPRSPIDLAHLVGPATSGAPADAEEGDRVKLLVLTSLIPIRLDVNSKVYHCRCSDASEERLRLPPRARTGSMKRTAYLTGAEMRAETRRAAVGILWKKYSKQPGGASKVYRIVQRFVDRTNAEFEKNKRAGCSCKYRPLSAMSSPTTSDSEDEESN